MQVCCNVLIGNGVSQAKPHTQYDELWAVQVQWEQNIWEGCHRTTRALTRMVIGSNLKDEHGCASCLLQLKTNSVAQQKWDCTAPFLLVSCKAECTHQHAHKHTYKTHICVHTADQHRQELNKYTNSTSGLSLLPSAADQNHSPSISVKHEKYVQDGCIKPPVAGFRQSVFLVACSGCLDLQLCHVLAPKHTKLLQGCSPTPYAWEHKF